MTDELDLAQISPLAALRIALERRGLGAIAALEAPIAEVAPAGDLVLCEVTAFRELAPDLLAALVVSLLASLHSRAADTLLWVHGGGGRLRFYLGQLRRPGAVPGDGRFVQTAAAGFFKGAEIESVSVRRAGDLVAELVRRSHAAVICGIPSEREVGQVETRLDEALEALSGRSFDVLVRLAPHGTDRAVPDTHELDAVEADLTHIVNAARAFASIQDTQQSAVEFTEAFRRSHQAAHEGGTIDAAVESVSTRHARLAAGTTAAAAAGAVFGGLIGLVAGPAGAALAAPLGASIARAMVGERQRSHETTARRETTQRTSVAEHAQRDRAVAETTAMTRTISLSRVARQAEQIEQLAEDHLERIRHGRALGAFETTVVVAGDERTDVELAAHTLVGALRGHHSHLEPLRVIPVARGATAAVLRAATGSVAPRWRLAVPALGGHGASASTLLTTPEAALWLRPPSHPIAGVSVKPNTRFHRTTPDAAPARTLPIGHLVIDGRRGQPLVLDRASLCRHCFVAGTTGAGKTTTVRVILRRLFDGGVPFMLVEPVKSEYRMLFEELRGRGDRGAIRLVVGPPTAPAEQRLCFNPFRPVAGLPIGRYVDQFRILLQSCFAMQESLPQLLEAVVVAAYQAVGLDLSDTMPDDYRGPLPTFRSLIEPELGYAPLLDTVVDRLGYAAEARQTLKAALRVRLESFTQGVKQPMFAGGAELDWADLVSRPCFVDLSDLTDPYARRLVLGALLLRMAGYRESEARRAARGDADLRHMLVLEEAHHFLREPHAMAPGAELVRHSNELLADALAEMRGYGQGILIADQSPAELAPAVLRNTGTKLAHGLFYERDCQAMGDAMGIDAANRVELRRLAPGECLVHAPGFHGAVHARIDQE